MNEPQSESPPPAPADQRFLGGRGFDLLVGLGVLLISVVSLFVAVSANSTQERMLAASVWPTLQFGTSNVSLDGERQIAFDLLNRGIGPARIRWAELSYDGKPVQTLGEYLRICCDYEGESIGVTSGLRQRVLGSDEWIQVVRIPYPEGNEALFERLDRARHQVRLRACYCSVLDDCWLLDSQRDEPEPVKACPAAPPVLWGS
ncbi:hypothetical protein [Arenimonas fontis]|uniref:Uncharacterized protein n=1 Tax=Arenimonas fontis TaxID=2608255 RepID=A0A5B2ZC18_9GAMM|nr:hypothetical protein [Arenimonas fontis]KAA2285083.1 hypothetical protein F0415_07520 [Arenimonas fontis]